MEIMSYIWAGIFVAALIIEGATAGLATIWFAAGSLLSFVLSLLKVPIPVQIAVFAVVSVLLLIFTRPLVKKYVNKKKQSTNADRLLGQEAIVTEKIQSIPGTGRIVVNGLDWAAKSADGSVIEQGAKVVIENIEGVKAVVKATEEKSE